MERIKKTVILVALILCSATASAQAVDNLWITGSAVPGGTQQLTTFPDNQFKFAGELLPGEVKIMTTPEPNDQTQYLVPRYYQSYIVNNGLAYQMSRDASQPGWIVTFQETRYRFTVNTSLRKLTGELFQPWDELFIVGGCVECGWESYVMLPFVRDKKEICRWTWTGELRNRPENVEPRRFKIMGQNAWDPKQLHPFRQDESPLATTQVCTGGDDNKWQIQQDGTYRLTVDVFRETFQAEFLGASDSQPTDIRQPEATACPSSQLFDLQGHPVTSPSPQGIYIYQGRKVRLATALP